MKSKVLFVCMGNICRSPTAASVFRHYVSTVGLNKLIETDSAGTHAGQIGSPADSRAVAAAARRSYDLRGHKARQIRVSDFQHYDHILAMDETNLANLKKSCPTQQHGKIRLLLDYAPALKYREVPDPYYGGPEVFELVLDLVEESAVCLLDELRQKLDR